MFFLRGNYLQRALFSNQSHLLSSTLSIRINPLLDFNPLIFLW